MSQLRNNNYKKTVFIISIIAFTHISFAQKENIRYAENLFKDYHYNETVICLSLLYLGDYSFLFSDTTFKNKMSEMYPYQYFDELSQEEKYSMYFSKLDACLNSLPDSSKWKKLDKIKLWCDNYNVLCFVV